MIPCTETKNGEIHARAYGKALCGKDGVLHYDIGDGQWGERDGQMPPLRWCKVCSGFLTARGLVVPKVAEPKVAVVTEGGWAERLAASSVRKHTKGKK